MDIGLERIEGPAPVPVREALEVRTGDALAIAQDDVPRDRLEAGPEMLARLDEDVPLATRVDTAVSEYAHVERLAAALRDDDLHVSRIEHGGTAHAHARARGHRPRDHELPLRDARDLAGDGQRLAREIDLWHVDLAAQGQRHAGRRTRGQNARDAGRIADRSGHDVR